MQYVAAYTLAALSCDKPTKDAVIAILKATGKPVDDAQVDALFKATGDKPAHELIAKGESKVGSVGGSGAPSAPAAGKKETPAPAGKPAAKPAEVKPAPPPAEAEDEDFNLDLFG